jgi:hypothetical protein
MICTSSKPTAQSPFKSPIGQTAQAEPVRDKIVTRIDAVLAIDLSIFYFLPHVFLGRLAARPGQQTKPASGYAGLYYNPSSSCFLCVFFAVTEHNLFIINVLRVFLAGRTFWLRLSEAKPRWA